MLDINTIRADFAAYLVAHAGTKHSLDAALMHVVGKAYRKGLADGMDCAHRPIELFQPEAKEPA